MRIAHKIHSFLNRLVKKTHWYENQLFSDCPKFWNHSTFNVEVINLGSSSGVYAFDYSDLDIKAFNWAMRPQPLLADFEILRNYCSYLQPGATILLPLCPFSSMVGFDAYFPDKYYTLLHHSSLPHYSIRKKMEVYTFKEYPIGGYPCWDMLHEVRMKCRNMIKKNQEEPVLGDVEMEVDAQNWINLWKAEFSISELDDELSGRNRNAQNDAILILKDIIDFCLLRKLKPVLVLPPMSKSLSCKFSQKVREIYVYSFVERANEKKIPFLDYWDDERFFHSDLYFNSFFLNLKGRKLFTRQVLQDIGIK